MLKMDGNAVSSGMKTVHAVCSLDCPDSCGVLVTVDTASGKAVKVQGDPAHPVTRGFLCGKVAKYLDRVYAPDRLLYPMRRKPGVVKGPLVRGQELESFERVSWDEALSCIVDKLKAVVAQFGAESVLPYSYAGTIGQLGYGSMDRRFFYRLGASQLDRTICAAAGGEALKQVYGVKIGTTPQEFAEAGLIIAWGANIHGNNVHLWPFIEEARRHGGRLVVIDPYKTRTAALADEHLQINPGTDGLLALGLMHVIFREGLEDTEYMASCTHGAPELRLHALKAEHAPERVAVATGITASAIVALARSYALAGRRGRNPAAIRLNYGIQRSENGGTAARAVAMLPLITGSWKYRGGGLLLSMSGAFPFNEAKLHMPELMQKSSLGRAARVVNMNQLGAALTDFGRGDDLSAVSSELSADSLKRNDRSVISSQLSDVSQPPVKALFVYNSNPAAVAPNQNAVLKGMRRDDLFMVVHDQFFTDTADYADILLPAPTFLENKDVQGSYGHRFVQITERAIEPRGEVRNNVEVFGELGRRMFPGESWAEDGVDELIDQALETKSPWMAGISRERLEREGHVPLAVDGLPFSNASWFRTASGKGELLPVPKFVPPVESRAAEDETYPLEFLPRKADNFMNSTFANHSGHQKMETATAGVLEMHAEDAAARGVAPGDQVEVFNARGRIALRVKLSGKVGKGVVAARLDWNKLGGDSSGRGANVNALTSERLTDIGGGATFYSTLVQVRKTMVRGEFSGA
jgi:anaerobic selenocysteine-containing dehydrogenase